MDKIVKNMEDIEPERQKRLKNKYKIFDGKRKNKMWKCRYYS